MSVRLSRVIFRRVLGASYAVYPALFSMKSDVWFAIHEASAGEPESWARIAKHHLSSLSTGSGFGSRYNELLQLRRDSLKNEFMSSNELPLVFHEGGGPWICGETFTLADISWIPILERMEIARFWSCVLSDNYGSFEVKSVSMLSSTSSPISFQTSWEIVFDFFRMCGLTGSAFSRGLRTKKEGQWEWMSKWTRSRP